MGVVGRQVILGRQTQTTCPNALVTLRLNDGDYMIVFSDHVLNTITHKRVVFGYGITRLLACSCAI
jgi:hypothetical protein